MALIGLIRPRETLASGKRTDSNNSKPVQILKMFTAVETYYLIFPVQTRYISFHIIQILEKKYLTCTCLLKYPPHEYGNHIAFSDPTK